ncbi:MAG TPA: hypothetical protein VH744_10560, partial [Terriglobales bacterium]
MDPARGPVAIELATTLAAVTATIASPVKRSDRSAAPASAEDPRVGNADHVRALTEFEEPRAATEHLNLLG